MTEILATGEMTGVTEVARTAGEVIELTEEVGVAAAARV